MNTAKGNFYETKWYYLLINLCFRMRSVTLSV
jgi:hypothetical protein